MIQQSRKSHPTGARLIFKRFPGLVGKLPWMPMADLPTPVERLAKTGKLIGANELWIKRDELTSDLYGGNKPRKFEFIFAEAREMGRNAMLTLGGAGSNHAVATSLFCRRHGFSPILSLCPQPVLTCVRRNILVNQSQQAKLSYSSSEAASIIKAIDMRLRPEFQGKTPPYFMYFGGSSPIGTVGFIEAGLELAEQISQGALPLPRYLFVTTGSCGTHAGLLIGLKLAGIPTEVIGVSVVPRAVTNRFVVAFHANRAMRFLRKLDPSIPKLWIGASQVRLIDNFFGGQYGRPTPECKAAIKLATRTRELSLDPTYTGKTFAAMTDFLQKRNIGDEAVLFWQTLNNVDLSRHYSSVSSADIPPEMQRYFSEELFDSDL
jgi:1-aminocyclopropane-1-carboxylate deaminase/D-cysteine desulfhydrase-like pyridoxal-dependent ACC family enzyme